MCDVIAEQIVEIPDCRNIVKSKLAIESPSLAEFFFARCADEQSEFTRRELQLQNSEKPVVGVLIVLAFDQDDSISK